MTQLEFESAMAEYALQIEAFQKFQDEVGQYVSGDFAYVGVPADYVPTVTCCDTTINSVRFIGSNEEIPALAQYAVAVVTWPTAPEAPAVENPPAQ